MSFGSGLWRGRRQRSMIALVAAGTVLIGAGCSSSSHGSTSTATTTAPGGSQSGKLTGSYQIGRVVDLTGPLGPYTAGVNAGFDFAASYINSHGGVNNKRLVLGTAVDSQGTPTGAQAAYRAVIATNPIAMVNFTASTAMVGVQSLLAQAAIAQFSTSGVPSSYLQEPWFYNFDLTNSFISASMLAGVEQALGGSVQGKKISIVYNAQSAAYTQDVKGLKTTLTTSGATVDPVITTQNTTPSFDAQAAQITSANPDAVMLFITGDASYTTAIKAILAAGYKGKILINDPGSSNQLMQAYGSAQVEAVRSGNVADPNTPLGQAARAAGVSSSVLGSNFFTWGVATVFGLAAALEKCGASCSSSSQLLSATASLGQVTLPLDVLPGPANFSRHDVFQYAQLWTWNPSTSSTASVGSAFDVYSG